eukprot:347746-Rhodomonas_salina.1
MQSTEKLAIHSTIAERISGPPRPPDTHHADSESKADSTSTIEGMVAATMASSEERITKSCRRRRNQRGGNSTAPSGSTYTTSGSFLDTLPTLVSQHATAVPCME